jgi:RecA-family ATPase
LLEALGELFEKREALEVAKKIEGGNLSCEQAIEALREIAPEARALPQPRPLIQFGDSQPDPTKTLLGNRFLCIEGGMLFVGPSGIGKTSASIQQDLLWSTGQPAFGIAPSGPLQILAIQAEDDDGDLSEIVSGVKAGLRFTPEQYEQSRENCLYVAEKGHTGLEFLEKIVRPLLKKYRPDLLRINPLHAYLGGC